ncbi:uncharacterized protein LOC110824261 [Carica papaya]|uniref:Regulator of Vps4 activity in the MVB pathway protein n=1 Tax=Carica papaya TaxID=3649 RepID=A6YGF0_CARPA|nr:uncharacterized protein LOC110824261 [Carica papaya]ABS01355.1 unknown [Carica papaya]
MGKKLDALLGRNFKPSKFKPIVNLAISRLAVLKNQRQVKFSQARSDVVKLLELGHHERALLRVEQVIKEQNMLDVFVSVEGYCNLLLERIFLLEQERVCPDELKEAVSSLLFVASRVGDFPELQEIRAILTSRYGKEFAASCIELRNNCGVSPKIIQKLSTRKPDLEKRMKVLKEIAAEKSMVLQLEESSASSTEEKSNIGSKSELPTKPGNDVQFMAEPIGKDDNFSDTAKGRKKYKDVADAAQAAFESAAYAAAAARAAVELSRSDSHDPDDKSNPSTQIQKPSDESKKLESDSKNEAIHSSDKAEGSKQRKEEAEYKRSMSGSSTDSADDNVKVPITKSFREIDPTKLLDKEIVFYDSDDESGKSNISGRATQGSGMHNLKHSKIEKGPISVRTRQVRGY